MASRCRRHHDAYRILQLHHALEEIYVSQKDASGALAILVALRELPRSCGGLALVSR